MPRLIRGGAIVQDDRLPPVPEGSAAAAGHILSLEHWQQLEDKSASAVWLEPGESPEPLYPWLQEITLVAVNFPVFTDGRGFSYARDLRERGYNGELRACGHFIRDQMTYLQRVGFNAFQMANEADLAAALGSLSDFSVHYQAAIDEPLPLFRRRA